MKKIILITILFITTLLSTMAFAKDNNKVDFIINNPNNIQLSNELLKLSRESKKEITDFFKITYDKPIKVQVYTEDDFKKSTENLPEIGGFAISEMDLVVLSENSIKGRTKTDIKNLLKHEITHIILGNIITHGSNEHLPRWFNEGVSQWLAEGANELFSEQYQNALQTSYLTEKQIPLEALTTYFPINKNAFTLSYAESLSFVQFLITKYGEANIKGLVKELTKEKTFESAFFNVYKTNFQVVEAEWSNFNKKSTFTWDYYLATHINSFIDGLMVLAVIISFIVAYRKNKKKKHEFLKMEEVSSL